MNDDVVTNKLKFSKLKEELLGLDSRYFKYFKNKYSVRNISEVRDAVILNCSSLTRFGVDKLLKRLSNNPIIQSLHN